MDYCDSKTPLPIQSNYKSSIGSDRISAVVGALSFPNKIFGSLMLVLVSLRIILTRIKYIMEEG